MLNLIPTDIGRWIGDITPRINIKDLEKRILETIDAVIRSGNSMFRIKKGTGMRCGSTLISLSTKRSDGAVIVLVDVDVMKRNEIVIAEAMGKIQQLNVELEERVHARTAQLASANKELEAFTGSVSHDSRVPPRGINLFAQILSEKYGDKLDADGQSAFQKIRMATQHMAQMVDDLLSLSQMHRQ